MLIFLAYGGLLAQSALVFLIEEMKERPKVKSSGSVCYPVGKDLFTESLMASLSSFLLTLPYSPLLTPEKKDRKFCGSVVWVV